MFADVIVSTDAESIAEIARHYGAEVPFLRPAEMAGDLSPDIEWVEHTLDDAGASGARAATASASCGRPARSAGRDDPPRLAARSWPTDGRRLAARGRERAGSTRARCGCVEGDRMCRCSPNGPTDSPGTARRTRPCREVYVQNASLEIAWCRTVIETGTIAGEPVVPFLTEARGLRRERCDGLVVRGAPGGDRARRACRR